ncbi:MAG: hypothetical protein E6G03_04300 [Actinobacteria bacterium]|nr:MAG: hypothetical protein E6G03_04300 [Actinomycetota bacterium]
MRRIRRTLVFGGLMLGLGLLVPIAYASPGNGPGSRPAPTCPSFNSANFHKSTTIDNQYFPLVPGTRFTYNGTVKQTPVVDIVYVTRNVSTIAGVKTVEVRDQVFESGVLTEDTLDWYGQDDQGNVWYFGEFATQLPAGTHDGSWTAGVDGAQPGYIMEASPTVGDRYCQENAPGAAQDAGEVLSVTASRSVPFGSYAGNVLQTKDYSLLEPKNENKFYEPGVGMLEAISTTGPSEDIQLSTIEHGV